MRTPLLQRAVLALAVVALTTSALLVASPRAVAFDFQAGQVRDWVQNNYYRTFYSVQTSNECCTCMASLGYRFGAGVPFGHYGWVDTAAWWTSPDDWGWDVGPTLWCPSWVHVETFRNHFADYPPSGTHWTRTTLHRCSVCPQEDTRWYGGYLAIYHGDTDWGYGSCAWDYNHLGAIYGRHVYSSFAAYKGMQNCYGTCKVDRSADEVWRAPNFINLADRKSLLERREIWVAVNTLVNN